MREYQRKNWWCRRLEEEGEFRRLEEEGDFWRPEIASNGDGRSCYCKGRQQCSNNNNNATAAIRMATAITREERMKLNEAEDDGDLKEEREMMMLWPRRGEGKFEMMKEMVLTMVVVSIRISEEEMVLMVKRWGCSRKERRWMCYGFWRSAAARVDECA